MRQHSYGNISMINNTSFIYCYKANCNLERAVLSYLYRTQPVMLSVLLSLVICCVTSHHFYSNLYFYLEKLMKRK